MKKMLAAMLTGICWIPVIDAQEITNQREYGACKVETEVDAFTDEEKHRIECMSVRGLLDGKDISFVRIIGGVSYSEGKSTLLILINSNDILSARQTETSGNLLVRIDQNEPETITDAEIVDGIGSGVAVVNSSESIREFLENVKTGRDRIAIRIGTTTEAMPLSSQTTAAIEDVLNRSQNVPAFRTQD